LVHARPRRYHKAIRATSLGDRGSLRWLAMQHCTSKPKDFTSNMASPWKLPTEASTSLFFQTVQPSWDPRSTRSWIERWVLSAQAASSSNSEMSPSGSADEPLSARQLSLSLPDGPRRGPRTSIQPGNAHRHRI